MIKLNTNENPYPPAPGVEKALREMDTDTMRLYPDPTAGELVHAIAKNYRLKDEQVFVGVGSDDVLAMSFLTFFNSQKPVLFPDITYSFYDVWADLFRIPYERPALDENFHIRKEDYFRENGGIVFPNPNAPTGVEMPLEEVEDIIRHNPDVIVIVDEAYVDFGGQSALAPREVGEEDVVHPLKEVLRVATKEDDEREAQNRVREREAFKICQKKIREHGLEMKLIDAEYTFDNNKVLFYFTADGRIDFRQLVKDLAAIFKTRIELRQIGVRDETKILGGIGICGRCLCCHTYLSEFAPVSIKMAKEQNLSLNQTKISGVCGRLMCCLKNEQETYEELNKKLPGLGDTVTTPDGLTGTVHSVNVLRQRVKVIVEINDEKEIQEFPVDDLKFRPRKKKVKVSEKELKELGNLEDKKGDSKLND